MLRVSFASLLAILPAALGAQESSVAGSTGGQRDRLCFGVRLERPRCGSFFVLDLGGRTILTGKVEPPPGDRVNVYPRLASHYYADAGILLPVGSRSAVGLIGEIGGGEGRQGIGVRYVREWRPPVRFDLTAGPFRVEGHQLGVTRRQWANGVFGDATVHFAELLAVQARVDHVPGGGRMKPASAAYVGLRMEGKSAVKTSAITVAVAVVAFYVFYLVDPPDT